MVRKPGNLERVTLSLSKTGSPSLNAHFVPNGEEEVSFCLYFKSFQLIPFVSFSFDFRDHLPHGLI